MSTQSEYYTDPLDPTETSTVDPTGDDPRVPGKGRLAETIVGFSTSAASAGLMGILAFVTKMPFVFPSLGATVFLLFYRSDASAAAPRNTISGHIIAVLSGLFSLAIFGLLSNESAFIEGMSLARVGATALSLGITTAVMTAARLPHPPAGATTLIVSLGLLTSWTEILTLCGTIAITLIIATLTHRIFGTPYPIWRPFDEVEARKKKAEARKRA